MKRMCVSGGEIPVPFVHESEKIPRGGQDRCHHRQGGAERWWETQTNALYC